VPYSWFGQLKNMAMISACYWGVNLDIWAVRVPLENNFNFNVKLDAMKWKKVSHSASQECKRQEGGGKRFTTRFARGTRLRQDYGAAGRGHQPSLTAVAKAMAGQEAMAWQAENFWTGSTGFHGFER
jgi:hypothetical protein